MVFRLLFVLCFLPMVLFAQNDSLKTFEIGVGAGQYFANVDFSLSTRGVNELSALQGTSFGIGLRYFQNRLVGFLAEINYTNGGWSETVDDIGSQYERQLGYVEAQIITQLAIGRKRIRPFLQAGPYVAFPIEDQESIPAGFTFEEGDTYFGQPLDFRINYGLIIGTGLYIKIGPIGLQAEGRFLQGLSDIIRSGTNGVSTSRRQAFGWRLTGWYEFGKE